MDYGPWGHVDYSLSLNYNDTKVLKVAKPPSNVSPNATILDSVAGVTGPGGLHAQVARRPERLLVQGPLEPERPGELLRLQLHLRPGRRRAASVLPAALRRSAFLTDFEGGYDLRPRDEVQPWASNNAFNVYPNKLPYGYRYSQLVKDSSGFATQYSAAPYGYNGGFYYGRLTWTF